MSEIRQLVDDIVVAVTALDAFYNDPPRKVVPLPPATAGQISDLADYLSKNGLPFPPSYREFLAVCNGIIGFENQVDLLSSDQVAVPPSRDLKSDYPSLSRFIIASGRGLAFVTFDPEAVTPDGEMAVVWVTDDGEEAPFGDSFIGFLREYLETIQGHVAREQADRAGLGD